jgi:prophage antirepressor-like protein
VRFVGTSQTPECIGLDIVGILYPEVDLKDRATYLCRISSRYKGVQKVQTPSGAQEMVTVLEPGLYSLLALSDSPLAIPIFKWIFGEVLPSIRKHGFYSV